jgi:hypothetical protein
LVTGKVSMYMPSRPSSFECATSGCVSHGIYTHTTKIRWRHREEKKRKQLQRMFLWASYVVRTIHTDLVSGYKRGAECGNKM